MNSEIDLLSKERHMTIDPSGIGTTALCCVDENDQISFFSNKSEEWRGQLAFIKDKVASFQPTIIVYEDCDFVRLKGGRNMTGLFKLFGGMEALSLHFDFIQIIGSISVIRVKAIHKALYKKVRQIEGLTYEVGRGKGWKFNGEKINEHEIDALIVYRLWLKREQSPSRISLNYQKKNK